MPIKLLYTVVIHLFLTVHPFHVSVCDMEYDAETKALQISQRIFMDDLGVGLQNFHKIDYIDTYKPKDIKVLDSLIAEYVKAKLFINIDGKPAQLKFIGSEVEGDARWCYIEIENVEKINKAEVSNLILFESFEDQENIIHMKVNGSLKSYKLNKKEKIHAFNFN
ncbi:MAG: hypothetical protein ACI905_002612 [Roseivirga sp.]|jgi:hypothetical protein